MYVWETNANIVAAVAKTHHYPQLVYIVANCNQSTLVLVKNSLLTTYNFII